MKKYLIIILLLTASFAYGQKLSGGNAGAISLVQKDSAYTAAAYDYTINCTAGTFAVTLPTAVGRAGKIYIIKNSGTGIITIKTTAAQTIDGTPTSVISVRYNRITVQSNGSNWIII